MAVSYDYDGILSELELLNGSVAVSAFVLWCLCIRYLVSEVFRARHAAREMNVCFGFREALHSVSQLRMAVGFLVFLTGEWTHMGYRWFLRFFQNTGRDEAWLLEAPWAFSPIVSIAFVVIGFACVARAIVPRSWGRFGYWLTIGATLSALAFSQLPDVRAGDLWPWAAALVAIVAALVWAWLGYPRQPDGRP